VDFVNSTKNKKLVAYLQSYTNSIALNVQEAKDVDIDLLTYHIVWANSTNLINAMLSHHELKA
jgi:hypothetical protein